MSRAPIVIATLFYFPLLQAWGARDFLPDMLIRRWWTAIPQANDLSGISMIPSRRGTEVMPNVLVRDLDNDVLKQLKAAAKANRRSLQAEIHDVLRRANTRNLAETRRLSAKWLKRLGRSSHSDSAALIREDRDAR